MIHEQSISNFGGDPGHCDYTDGRIDAILAQQFPVFGFDKYPDVFQKAAMLWYFLTKGHCFVDGNKRVGIQSSIVLLIVNGFIDNLDDDEGYSKSMEIAASTLPESERDSYIETLATWLSKRFQKPE